MNVEDELATVNPEKETWFSVGVFDGVHLGHQQLLTRLIENAKKDGNLTGVLTFKSHPETVIRSSKQPWINDLDTRVKLIKQAGIDIVVVLDFTRELRQLDARKFLALLKKYLKIRGLVMGPDFALGRDRAGSIDALRTIGQEMDFAVEVLPPFELEGEIVSSSSIRKLIMSGDVKKAASFLGRPFSLSGQPVPGAQRGRTMGFPTINIVPEAEMVSPADGVYATISHIAEGSFKSVTNVGVNPTFGGSKRVIETFLLDYSRQSEINRVEVAFVERLRNEVRFKDSRELIDQMKKDVEVARSILKNNDK